MKFLGLFFFLTGATPVIAGDFLVVLDAGHGGADTGATIRADGALFTEKDLTLLLTQETANELRSHGIKTVLTRRDDRDVPLDERTALANRLGATVFVSIHMNAAEKRDEHNQGIETYTLNLSTDRSNQRLVDLENAVLKGSRADRFNKTDIALIVKDLLLNANQKQSLALACLIQNQLVRGSASKNRGVKQALFYVLLGADMPSVLVEAGFMSHTPDRNRVIQPESRRIMARSLASAIMEFQKVNKAGGVKLTGPCTPDASLATAQHRTRHL